MKTINEIINRGGNSIACSSPISANTITGSISEISMDDKSGTYKICEVISPGMVNARPQNTPEECISIMLSNNIRYLPVVENDDLIGIVSIAEIIKAVLEEKNQMIDQLVHYIADTPPIQRFH
jgi:predicted transcriptional regulator